MPHNNHSLGKAAMQYGTSIKIQPHTLIILMMLVLGVSACDNGKVTQAPSPVLEKATLASEVFSELIDTTVLNQFTELEARLQGFDKATVEVQSSVLAEVDGWLFSEEEESKARSLIDKKIELLRQNIVKQVNLFRKQAVQAPNGKEAHRIMHKVGSMMALYPAPATESEQKNLVSLGNDILATTQRIEEIRRLRFNRWALDQTTKTMDKYYELTKINNWKEIGKLHLSASDRDNIIEQCAPILAKINPDALEPMTRNLYENAINTLLETMGDNSAQQKKLAEYFTNPKLIRKSLLDF